MKVDFDNIDAPRQLAKLFKEEKHHRSGGAPAVYQRIAAIDPFDPDVHATLGRLAMQRNDHDAAAREFTAVLALKPVDLASAHTDLAESYLKGGKRTEAKRETLAALEIAPSYERAQNLLLELAGAR
jgi:Flp pilus assembly protein TadD